MTKKVECFGKKLCVDCKDECKNKGNLRADCPKPKCDQIGDKFEKCDKCSFMRDFLKNTRRIFKRWDDRKEE